MRKMTATVGDIIAALSKISPDTPVFGYSSTDECDMPIDAARLIRPEPGMGWNPETGEEGIISRSPLGCQADSYIEDYWRQFGDCLVLVLGECCASESNEHTVNFMT